MYNDSYQPITMIAETRDFFLSRSLFFIEPNFWSAEECWQLRQISGFGSVEHAGIYSGGKLQVDPGFRQTKRIILSDGLHHELERSIWTIKPRLENHFGLRLNKLQPSQLLQYEPGGHFRTHQDEGREPSPETRKVSIVIFLNSKIQDPHSKFESANLNTRWFDGGDLVFYKDQEGRGFSFPAEEGLLLAFSPYLFHEVQEVTKGIRLSVVTWFL